MPNLESEQPKFETLPIDEKSPEEQINPDDYVDEKITQMNNVLSDIEEQGGTRLTEANDSIGLPPAETEDIKKELAVDAEQTSIVRRANDLFQKTRSKMKKILIMGTAALTFSSVGDMAEEKPIPDNPAKEIKPVEKIHPIKYVEKKLVATPQMSQKEREAIAAYNKAIEENEDFKRKINPHYSYEEKMKSVPEGEQKKARENLWRGLSKESRLRTMQSLVELRWQVSSSDYLKKLIIEYNGDEERAKDAQKRRIAYLDFLKITRIEGDKLNEDFVEDNYPNEYNWLPKWLKTKVLLYEKLGISGVAGQYSPKDNEVIVSTGYDKRAEEHEFDHASTRGSFDMSERAMRLFKEAFQETGKANDKYYKNPAELLVRMHKLSSELIEKDIWKYGEKFTDKHFREMMILFRKGELSYDAQEFIKRIKPSMFKTLLNEIALNNPATPDSDTGVPA